MSIVIEKEASQNQNQVKLYRQAIIKVEFIYFAQT